MENITDQKLKSYFLGNLAVEEMEVLEEECAADAELTEQAHIVESELADDYLRGSLSAAERRLFEENYLITEARKGKLRSAENLWKIAAEHQTTAETPAPTFRQTLFAFRRVLAFGGLAAIVFGGFVLVWLYSVKSPEIAEQKNINQTPDSNVKNQAVETTQDTTINQNLNTKYNSQKGANSTLPKPTVTPEIKATPKPIEPTAPTVATFLLLPGTLRSEGEQFAEISPNTSKVNFRLALPKDAAEYQTYRAVLKTADGKTVLTSPNLKSLNLWLPAAKLENRTYIVFLEGQNAQDLAESIAEYTFRVRR